MTRFIILQASVVFNNQLSFIDDSYEDTKEGRNQAFRDVFEKIIDKKIVKINPKIIEYVLLYRFSLSNDILYCQLAKKTEIDCYKLNQNEIRQELVENYPPLHVFVNLRTQQLAVELNSTILSVPAIEKNINNLLNSQTKQFSIFANAIQDKQEFWNLINQDEYIQEISFDLVVPNIFGATEEAKKLVDDAKEKLNADSVALSFKNQKGKLNASIVAIDSFVKYSSNTGSWKLKYKKRGESHYKTIKSTDLSKKAELNGDIIETIKQMDKTGKLQEDFTSNLINKIEELFENGD